MGILDFMTPALVIAASGFLWRELRRIESKLEGKIDALSRDHASLSTRIGRIEGHLLGREALELTTG